LSQNLAELLLLRARTRFSRGEFERAKLDVAQALLDLATQVQSAYYGAVGAQQVALMRKTITADASAAADLSARFKDAGNQTALQLALYRAAESQAKLDEERAEADAARAVSLLNEVMGLDADAHLTLRVALSSPIAHEETLDELRQLASKERLDLQSARRGVRLLEDSRDLTRRYRFLGVVDVGVQYERDTDGNRLLGPSLSLQLPLFSRGQAPLLRAQSRLELARAELAAKELEVCNGVMRSHERVTAARKRVARLREEGIPLREAVVAHTQEQVNYMLVGVFELLRVKQEEYDTYQQYLEAVRDYWQARAELAQAAGTRLPSDASIGEATVMPRLPVEAPENSGHHGSNTATPSGPARSAVPTPPARQYEAFPPPAAPSGTVPGDVSTPEAPPHGDHP
jgi:outer membrane protein, heavy metal efflux system